MYTMREKKEMIHRIAAAKQEGKTDVVMPFHTSTLHVVFENLATIFHLLKDGVCKKTITSHKTEAEYDDYFNYGFNILGCLDALAMQHGV